MGEAKLLGADLGPETYQANRCKPRKKLERKGRQSTVMGRFARPAIRQAEAVRPSLLHPANAEAPLAIAVQS